MGGRPSAPRGDRPQFESLESRLLLSVDPSVSAGDFAQASDYAAQHPETAYVPGEILVKITDDQRPVRPVVLPGGPDGGAAAEAPLVFAAGSALADLAASCGVQLIQPVFTPAALAVVLQNRPDGVMTAEEEAARDDLYRWYYLKLAPDADVEAAAAAFASAPGVIAAEPNYTRHLGDFIPYPIEGIPDGTTDPLIPEQWYLTMCQVQRSWNYLRLQGVHPGGSRDVVVAVIDSGVDYNHEDLVGNMWTNPREIPGNGLDDDQNGFVDDVHGCSVVSDPRSHSGDCSDVYGHGTHVAGIAAAAGFNHLGGAGVAFNVQIMSVRAAQYAGILTAQDVAEGILYAVDNGADVINMSFGGYGRSQIEIDALEVALSQAVLVAAAGNNGVGISEHPLYPAALPFVLGVMSCNTIGGLSWFSNSGYEILAPGESILSTLPGNQYAAWSGTSMAAPIASGAAALMRSYFWQRDVYSSRFIMGCLHYASYIPETLPDGTIATTPVVLDVYKALTTPPPPGVTMLENWLFDGQNIAPGNDGDGRVDSGETCHLGIELINRSGMATGVFALLRAHAIGATLDDPYVTINVPIVVYGDIGPFNIADNGFIYNQQGVITGVEAPFVFTVAPDCPNDHLIPFELTIVFWDGWDPDNTEFFQRICRFGYVVQRGQDVPRVIESGTTFVLTPDHFWLVAGPTLVEPGATLIVQPGASVQWGGVSDDPYNPGPQNGYIVVRGTLRIEGTAEKPVNMFPSYLVAGQVTNIQVDSGGLCDISYATIRNPYLSGIRYADHCYFEWDYGQSLIGAAVISNSRFHKFRGGGSISAGTFKNCVFEACWVHPPSGARYENCVFLQDNENNSYYSLTIPFSFKNQVTRNVPDIPIVSRLAVRGGETFLVMPMECTSLEMGELIAQYWGGHVASVRSAEEQAWIVATFGDLIGVNSQMEQIIIGMSDEGHPGIFTWLDGSPVTFTKWAEGDPRALSPSTKHVVYLNWNERGWGWCNTYWDWVAAAEQWSFRNWSGMQTYYAFLLRLPGEMTASDVLAPFGDGRMFTYVRDNLIGNSRYNAFLSKYWEPNVSRWMRILTPVNEPNAWCFLRDNFWGTDTTFLIDHAIYDYYDNFTSARLVYGTPPAHGYESTYPFVEEVLINGLDADTVPDVGAGPTTYTITFNRDMDTDVQPFVTFGPDAPFTDFRVKPLGKSDAVFTVSLSAPASQTVTVDYATEDGTALSGVDYEAASGTLTFNPGVVRKTVAVRILGDEVLEGNKTFRLRLSSPTVVTIYDGLGDATINDDDPTISVADTWVWEPDEGTREAVFTVTLTEACDRTVTVEYATEDGTAKAGKDYQASTGTVTFLPGETEKTLGVPVLGDLDTEADEYFWVRLCHERMANVGDRLGAGVIRGNAPILSIEDSQVVEGNAGTAEMLFTVRLWRAADSPVSVDYATADGTATAGQDYQAVSGTLTFLPGEPLTQTVTVSVIGDTLREADKTLFLNLSNAVGGSIADGQGTGAISDDDTPVLAIGDVSIIEGNAGKSAAVFTVTLPSAQPEAITVHYRTVDGTAVAGEDYLPSTGMLTFVPGQLVQTITVSVLGDTLDERDETFTVELHTATGALLPAAPATGTILDDEPAVTISDARVVEGDSGTADIVFTVTLSADPLLPVTIAYATADGTAAAGADYMAASGTLLFEPGQPLSQTITVSVIGDAEVETNEVFFLNLTSSSGVAFADAQGKGTIVGDDGPLFSIADASLLEGDTGTTYAAFTVSLSADPPAVVTVHYRTSDGTANVGKDYNLADATLTFRPGQSLQQTVYVPILGDLLSESHETFFVDLVDSSVVGIADDQAMGTITDDDPAASVDDLSVVEGESGATVVQFTVSISEDPVDTFTVQYATAAGTATEGTDYLGASGTLTFLPGQPLSQTITILVLGDTTNEVDETFFVNLSNPVNGNIADGQGRGTILDDDGPKITIDDVLLAEGDAGTTAAVFTVSLTQATDTPITVNWATANGTAVAGQDFQTASGTLTFQPGGATSQTVAVLVAGDLVDELDETFFVNLSGAAGAPIADSQGQATITDNDAATLSVDDVTSPEGFNGWINSRQWLGTFWITPVTGEGYHCMRINGAAAADDPWLVSGYDVGRFRFEVETMGVAAMTLQAVGQEGAIRLTWQQNDYDLLAGYNLYRSNTINGTYTRLNSTVIPVGSETWLDTDVQPAVPMFYKFTCVMTDMTESAFSNVASAAAVDTIAPVIAHAPATAAPPGFGLRLAAAVTDNVRVSSVTVRYRPMGSSAPYGELAMVNISGNDWSATIPGSAVQPPGVDYYLIATDGISNTYHGTPAAPHTVVVSNTPTLTSVSPNQGSALGGQTVTLSGTLFQPGATVLIGGNAATNINVLSPNQITCTTPPHYPAQVDVTVINPDDSQCTLINGYRFVSANAVVSLPTITSDRGTFVDLALAVSNVEGLGAADATIVFDSAVLRATDARVGPLAAGWTFSANTTTPGRVVLSMANATTVSGSGTLAYITVEVLGPPNSQTALTIQAALLNDGAIPCDLSHGLFTVTGVFNISGSVTYYAGGSPVPDTALSLVGVGVHTAATDAAGGFTLSDIPSGAYTLTPAKTDDVAEITAYDASLVLRAAVGLITLTPDQVLAADVNRNGMVTSMDAFYILQKSVELIDVPFPGAGRVWLFKPENRPYSLLVADQTGQNFTAILIGDVSGNWTHPGGGQGGVIPLNSPSAALLLPTVESHNAEQVVLPLSITFAGVEVYSADIIISYDVSALALESVAPGAVAAGCGYAFNTSQPGVIRAGFASSQPLAAGGTLMELTFDVVGTLQAPAPVSFVVAELNEGQIEASAHDGSVRDTIAPSVDAVELNQRAGRGVGAVDPSGLGVRTITLNFSERVNFSPDAVLVQKVAFPGGVETLGEALEPLAVSGFNTSAMQITLAPGAAVDTWVKVTLDTALLADPAGNRLAGGAIGPAAAFYVGSLRGDFDGDLAIGPDDRQGFRNAWLAGSPDADFRGVGFGPRPPDGRITLADIDGFTSVYQAGLALGRHLDPLPTSGGGLASNVVPLPALAMPDSGVDALAHARGLLPPSDQPPLVPTRQQASPSGESREDVRDALRLRRLRPAAAPPSAPAALMRLPDTLSSSIPIIS